MRLCVISRLTASRIPSLSFTLVYDISSDLRRIGSSFHFDPPTRGGIEVDEETKRPANVGDVDFATTIRPAPVVGLKII